MGIKFQIEVKFLNQRFNSKLEDKDEGKQIKENYFSIESGVIQANEEVTPRRKLNWKLNWRRNWKLNRKEKLKKWLQ